MTGGLLYVVMRMKFLLLIPSVAKTDIEADVRANRHPRMDYYELRDTLHELGHAADVLDYAALALSKSAMVRALGRKDKDSALALLGWQTARRGGHDAIYTNGENVAIPLALLLRGRKRPGHITIGHRPSTGKKRLFFRQLKVWRNIDKMFVYSALQQEIATQELQIPAARVPRIEFHADTRFYRPMPQIAEVSGQICSAGLEWRDYPTLIRAVSALPDGVVSSVRLAAASPWSKHTNETEKMPLPSNVSARRYAYDELRDLYAESEIVVVPLYDNDFQAGVTTLLESMAMGKAVIITRTAGQTDVVLDGETGLYVPPGDTDALQTALFRLLKNRELRLKIGDNARRWVEKYATIERWAESVARSLIENATAQRSDVGIFAAAAPEADAPAPTPLPIVPKTKSIPNSRSAESLRPL